MIFNSEKSYLINGETDICIYDEPCDEYLHSQHILYTGVTKVQFGEMSVYMIVVDSDFLKLDENVRNYLLYHEIGHIKNNHLNMTKEKAKRTILLRRLGILPKMEIEADCYAASVIGKSNTINALKTLMRNNNKRSRLVSKMELFRRSIRIK